MRKRRKSPKLMACFDRAILAIAPGWVRTDMGGADAALSIEESIPRVVDVIEAHGGKAGAHYVNYQGQTLPW